MLTARTDEIDVVLGLDAGADDYLAKPFRLLKLITRVRAHLRRGGATHGPAVPATVGLLRLDPRSRRVTVAGADLPLRAKEFDLLSALVLNARGALTRERLMAEVWDENWSGSTKTLDMHILSLRRKHRQPGPNWHPRLLHPGVTMQTSWMKDLVSLVDPTHPLTFMNYLVSTGRLYNLLNAQFSTIPRREYVRYLEWAAGRIDRIHWGVAIDRISWVEGAGFTVYADDMPKARSQHLVLGVGTEPYLPPDLAHLPEDRVCVPDDLADRLPSMTERSAPIAVVGGGQTGAECVLELLAQGFTDIRWLGRRPWFQPMDDSPPANEFYRPAYQQFLQGLARSTRQRLIEGQTLTGDAISPGTIVGIYQANYRSELDSGRFPVSMYPGRDVTDGELTPDGRLVLHATATEGTETHEVRYAVLATGRRPVPAPFDLDLQERVEVDDAGGMIIDADYSVRWKGSGDSRIYALNRARLSHGIPDANLTLLPVRAALVLNSILERQLLTVVDDALPVRW